MAERPSDLFMKDVPEWTAMLNRTSPLIGYAARHAMKPPPIIETIPATRSHRWWVLLWRIAAPIHDRIARLVKTECFDSYICGEHYWDRNDWDWLEAVEQRKNATAERHIRDWPKTITIGDYSR